MAELIGVSTLFVGYIECGQKGMSLETLTNVCNTLHTSADYLLLGVENAPSAKTESDDLSQLLHSVEPSLIPLLTEHIQLFLKTVRLAQGEPNKKDRRRMPAAAKNTILIAARNGRAKTLEIDSSAQADIAKSFQPESDD